MSTLTFSSTHNMVAFLEKLAETDGFHKIIDFLNANQIQYALTVNPTIYTPCIEQFWATAKIKTVNGERQIQALVDKKKVIITESSIRSDLHLEDADGTDCLLTATIFEELARMSAKTTAWNEFSNSGIPTASQQTPITIQPSTSKPQKKQSRRKHKKTTVVPRPSDSTADVPNEESTPTHSNDPLLSGEDRLKLTDLMDMCTKLSERVLDLEHTKTAQAQEITNLKLRVKKLEKKAGLRTHKFKRLYKVGVTRRVEYSNDESLSAQTDAFKQGRSIEDIEKDAEVFLVDETQGRYLKGDWCMNEVTSLLVPMLILAADVQAGRCHAPQIRVQSLSSYLGLALHKQKPSSLEGRQVAPVDAVIWISHMEKIFDVMDCNDAFKTRLARFLRLAGFLGQAAGTAEEQAKNFRWGLHKSILDHVMCIQFTDVAQVADAARNLEILRDRDDYDRSERSDKRHKSGDRYQSDTQQNNYRSHDQKNDRQGYGLGRAESLVLDATIGSRVSNPRFYSNSGSQQSRVPSEGYTHPVCNTCGRRHPGECRRAAGTCFKCGQAGHLQLGTAKKNTGASSSYGLADKKARRIRALSCTLLRSGRQYFSYHHCSTLKFDDKIRSVNALPLDMCEFDIILGIDWLADTSNEEPRGAFRTVLLIFTMGEIICQSFPSANFGLSKVGISRSHLFLRRIYYGSAKVEAIPKWPRPDVGDDCKECSWICSEKKSFDELMQRLVSSPILTLPSDTLVGVTKGNYDQLSQYHRTEFRVDDDGILWQGTKLCVPEDPTLREALMTEAHSSPFSIHPGSMKMYHDLKQHFWWRVDYPVSKLAEMFQQKFVRLHGTPSRVSNSDPGVTSHFWKGLQKALGEPGFKFSTAFI
ncbi:xylulose kinase-1 [Tanacetum coccineum]